MKKYLWLLIEQFRKIPETHKEYLAVLYQYLDRLEKKEKEENEDK